MVRLKATEPARARRPSEILAASLLLLLAAAGVPGRPFQEPVAVKNTCQQSKSGIYQCVLYIEASKEVLATIDDVRYTLPSGYPNRKQTVSRGPRAGKYFSSKPFTTAEEVIVNVKIDYKNRPDAYLSYRVRLLNNSVSEAAPGGL